MIFTTYTIHFETLGCKLNQIETEAAARFFSNIGFKTTFKPVQSAQNSSQETILCIVNTCTVTAKAEQKGRRIIRLLLEKYPHAAILVTGCYAQLDAAILESIDKRVAVLGGQHKGALSKLPDYMKKWYENDEIDLQKDTHALLLAQKMQILYKGSAKKAFGKRASTTKFSLDANTAISSLEADDTFSLSTETFSHHSRASIKIQDGCNNHCAYCRICFARGPSVSLDAKKIAQRIQQLEKANHSEVVITGVNLSQYRSEIPSDTHKKTQRSFFDVADLLAYCIEKTESISFRISSLYPERVDESLCSVLKHPRIQPHFHLSVQSGSDDILHRMRRPYNAIQVIEACKRLRMAKENPFIACDIIAGFPGETEKDFEKTLKMANECNFAWIHAFPFSARPGTEAYAMKDQISKTVSKKRVQRLTKIAIEQKASYTDSCIGKEYSAVAEKRDGTDLRVVTENFLHLRVSVPNEKKDVFTPKKLGGKKVQILLQKSTRNEHEVEGICTIKE